MFLLRSYRWLKRPAVCWPHILLARSHLHSCQRNRTEISNFLSSEIFHIPLIGLSCFFYKPPGMHLLRWGRSGWVMTVSCRWIRKVLASGSLRVLLLSLLGLCGFKLLIYFSVTFCYNEFIWYKNLIILK